MVNNSLVQNVRITFTVEIGMVIIASRGLILGPKSRKESPFEVPDKPLAAHNFIILFYVSLAFKL